MSSDNKQETAQKTDLILHIGTEKTGTTTIQEFLHLNRKLLANNGFYFPKSIGMRNHRPLATWCLSDKRIDNFLRMNNLTETTRREKWKEDFINQFEEELSGLNPEIKQVIISSEHFSSLLKQPGELETLKYLLDKWFKNIWIIVYLRRQDGLLISRYSTACRTGIVSKNILQDPSKLQSFFNYHYLLNNWSRIFGKENIFPAIFEKSMFYNSDLLSDFVCRCGLPDDLNYTIPKNKNESLSETAQEVAQLFNRKFPVDSTSIPIKELQKIRKEIIESVNANYPGSCKKSLRNEVAAFYKYFDKSNDQVAREWFGREKIFSEDFSMYSESTSNKVPVWDYEQILNEVINDKVGNFKTFLKKQQINNRRFNYDLQKAKKSEPARTVILHRHIFKNAGT
ncbi:MAG: hypothetical protein K8S16_12695, partial [Bacteroidales bacterium]|nr:hypothetical protein [Bacteroidales bacterium]